MSQLAPLFKVETFRSSVEELLSLEGGDLKELRAAAISEWGSARIGDQIRSEDGMLVRAVGILCEAAVRDGVEDVRADLEAALPDVSAHDVDRLMDIIRPTDDDSNRVRGFDERDAFLPILVDHRLALDLRVIDSAEGAPIATPFVSARLGFDAVIAGGASSVVFQINLADIDSLVDALTAVRARAEKLLDDAPVMKIPGWSYGLPARACLSYGW